MQVKNADTTVTLNGKEFTNMVRGFIPESIEGEIVKIQVTNVHVKKGGDKKGHKKTDVIKNVTITIV